MQAINTTLLMDQTGAEVTKLQEALIYFILNNQITGIENTAIENLENEYEQVTLSSTTAAIVSEYQQQHNLTHPTDPVLDNNTRLSINEMLGQELGNNKKVLTGYVKTTNGTPPNETYVVKLFEKTFTGRGKMPVSTSVSDAQGYYHFDFRKGSAGDSKKKGYEVLAYAASDTVYSSGMTYLYGDTLQLDIGLLMEVTSVSEYEEIYASITPLINTTFIEGDINQSGDVDKIEFLAAETGERSDYIRMVIEALRIKNILGNVSASLIYGLLRNNVPVKPEELINQSSDVLLRASTIALAGHIITSREQDVLEADVNQLRMAAISKIIQIGTGTVSQQSAIFHILNAVIGNVNDTALFLDEYAKSDINNPDPFWADLPASPFTAEKKGQLKTALQLAFLTGNNPQLVNNLLSSIGSSSLPDWATGKSVSDWLSLISSAAANNNPLFVYPAYLGTSTQASYAEYLYRQAEIMFPTQAIAKQIAAESSSPFPRLKAKLSSFLQANSGFDFQSRQLAFLAEDNLGFSYGDINDEADEHGLTDRDRFVAELGMIQRLMYLSNSYSEISALAANGYTSSLSIAQQPREQFLEKMTSGLNEATTAAATTTYNAVYGTAQNVANYAAAALITAYSGVTSSSGAGGASTKSPQGPPINGNTAPVINGLYFNPSQLYAEWRTLFGPLDSCDCCQCQSIYSPSAYMVDLLRFIQNNQTTNGPLHDELVDNRRPDIKHIQLTCKNANTPVPQIDIVNELLEDLISPTTAGVYKMYARQTGADAAKQRAIPEYVNTDGQEVMDWVVPTAPGTPHYTPLTLDSPYPVLASAAYPWLLPYNFYKRQADTHLELAGVKSHELIQRFGGNNKLAAFDNYRFCYEYLGISKNEADIITTPQQDVAPNFILRRHYGLKSNAVVGSIIISDPAQKGASLDLAANAWGGSTKTVVSGIPTRIGIGYRVDVFLQQTGLSYSELLQLRDCYSLNPLTTLSATIGAPPPAITRRWEILPNDPSVPDDTCDLSKLKIDGLDYDVLSLLYRFVRLARALGWTFYELDHVLLSLGITSPSGINVSGTGSPSVILVDAAAFGITSSGSNDAFNKIVQVKHLTSQLNISVEDATILLSLFNVLPYRNYSTNEPKDIPSIYERIFRNPAISDISAADYPFKPNVTFPTPAPSREIIISYLSGILNVAGNELELLMDKAGLVPMGGTIYLSLYMLGIIYREVLLLKTLGLTVSEWLFFRNWLGVNSNFGSAGDAPYNSYINFNASLLAPNDIIRLATLVKEFRDSGLSVSDAEYLLADNVPDVVADNKLNDTLSENLTTLRTQLKEKWAPAYTAASDTEGTQLLELLKRVTDVDKATRLVALTQLTTEDFNDMTPADLLASVNSLVSNLSFFLNAAGISATLATGTPGVTPTTPRRQMIFDQLDAYMRTAVLEPMVLSFFAKQYNADAGFIAKLLRDCIQLPVTINATTVTKDGLYFLTNKDFVEGTGVISRWATTNPVKDQINVALRLQKGTFLAPLLEMSIADIEYFWHKSNVFADVLRLADVPLRTTQNTPVTNVMPFSKLANLLRWMRVRSFLGENAPLLYPALESLKTSATLSKSAFLNTLANVYKMDRADIDTLLGATGSANGSFGVSFIPATSSTVNATYNLPLLYLRIIDALEMQHLLPSAMAVLADVASGIQNTAHPQADVNKVVQLVKAQYNEQEWPGIIRPVNDKLRVERRDAMVDYLLANPPAGCEHRWYTANDIFETLMVDVEMMACMSTSRILLAINSIQLWVDRIILGLEQYPSPTVPNTYLTMKMTRDGVRQWHSWRKRFRIWEANRKIFVYPENWIEPELRDGKTPLFVELEKFLKQNEVTDENVEAAYRTYLERLDELAHLDIIGIYRETTQTNYSYFAYDQNDVISHDTVHVFGRTPEQPHIYYYCKRVADEWTPWEKMDVQVEGNHFIPVMWRGRLRFYWLTFMKEQLPATGSKMRSHDEFVTPPSTRWKINLAWSEYKNGKWTAKQVSKDSLYSYEIEEENLLSVEHLQYFRNREPDEEGRAWYPAGTLEKQLRERFYWFSTLDSQGNLRFELTEKIVRNSSPLLGTHVKDKYSGIVGGTTFTFHNPTPKLPVITRNVDIPEVLKKIEADETINDMYPARTGVFTVQFNGVKAQGTPSVIPNPFMPLDWNTVKPGLGSYDVVGLERYIPSPAGIRHLYKGAGTDYHYDDDPNNGYAHSPDNGILLLGHAPDIKDNKRSGKYLVFPRQLPDTYVKGNKLEVPYFFYKDYDNTFFVEKVMLDTPLFNVISTTTKSGKPIATLPMPFYRFHNFRYSRVHNFREKLFSSGIDGLLDRNFLTSFNASSNGALKFASTYSPTSSVDTSVGYPENFVDFRTEAAFSSYNWELFFHIPLLIANKLSQNRQFEAARKWYQYVFDPTATVSTTSAATFWNFQPFYDEAMKAPFVLGNLTNSQLAKAVTVWANDPFKPHLVARTRISAYMKNTVMKYLDNLIAWGDDLFRSDSRESIIEATLLYVLAAQILGRKPVTIPARATPVVQTYMNMLSNPGSINAFGNALVRVESIMYASGVKPGTAVVPGGAVQSTYYFCMPSNTKLNAYWDTLADRLFKIRNCRNIDGVERDLALYDPPIDPALLVKAAAAGISATDAMAAANAPLPNYRFNVMAQKATELAGEVKALGGQLLSALEKKDAEHLALLRSSQEQKVLDAVTELKERSVEEAVTQINGLQQQQKMTTQRRDHYKRLIDSGLNSEEQLQLDSMKLSIPLHISEGITRTLAGGMHAYPTANFGPFIGGISIGGPNVAQALEAAASVLNTASNVNSVVGSMAATKGSFARRKEDWELQLKLADTELKQIDKQIIGAQIRQAMAEKELSNHKLQVQNALEMDEAMRDKFTNEELYDWMVGQISFSYFAAFRLAVDVAKRAERCYQNELNLPLASFIGYEYWDSLYKGLMAGEQLAHDIKRIEVSYLEKNRRTLELTKHISLAALDPTALIDLRTKKSCDVRIPEWLYDLDYPGQHMRRIKSVSISIPCVAGPYTTVACKLSLLKSRYRTQPTLAGHPDYSEAAGNDDRFQYIYGPIQSIATSHAQNDSGMFDFSFRDERYLPFEGAGAIGDWKIELPGMYAQFDYDSVSDVILHINYTALDEGGLKASAATGLTQLMSSAAIAHKGTFFRLFDLKHEFPNEWQQLMAGSSRSMNLQHLRDRLPYLAQSGASVQKVECFVQRFNTATSSPIQVSITPGSSSQNDFLPASQLSGTEWWHYTASGTTAYSLNDNWVLKATLPDGSDADSLRDPATVADIQNIFLLVSYTV